MRLIRIIIQTVLAALFIFLMLVTLRGPFNPGLFIGIIVFFGFLFLLTLMLREHTESRLIMGRQINPKVTGSFITLIGLMICWTAWLIATDPPMLNGGGRRRQLLAFIIEIIGPWPPTVVFLVLGITMVRIGCRIFQSA